MRTPSSCSASSRAKGSSTTRAELHRSVDGLHIAIGAQPPHLLDGVASRLSAFQPAVGRPDAGVEIVADPVPAVSLGTPVGRRRRLFEDAHELDYYPEADTVRLVDVGVAASCDAAAGTVRILVRDDDARAVHLASHLFFSLSLLEILRARGRYPVHAAGVALGGRAVLLAGASGAGKSTLALACARAGWAFLGDDTVLLHQGGPRGLAIHGFPDEIDLPAESLRFFPELDRSPHSASPRAPEKRHLCPLDIDWIRIVPEARPAALVFPVPAASAARLVPVSPDDALIELVPNVVRTDARVAQLHLDALAALARVTPAYRLEIADPFAAPELLSPLATRSAGPR